MAATQRVMILTGGPGCRKTFCTRTIVALWKAMGKKIALAAPTGRAAHQINWGQYPSLEPISDAPESDCLRHSGGFEPEHGVQAICELIRDFVPSLGFDPVTDVQVLCPMTRGVVGARNLNPTFR